MAREARIGHRRDSLVPMEEIQIPQNYAQEVTACVWGGGVNGKHASLQLRRNKKENAKDLQNKIRTNSDDLKSYRYISFWPANSEVVHPDSSRNGMFVRSYIDDTIREMNPQTNFNLAAREKVIVHTDENEKYSYSEAKSQNPTPYRPKPTQKVLHYTDTPEQDVEKFRNMTQSPEAEFWEENWVTVADKFTSMQASNELDLRAGGFLGLDMNRMVDFCLDHKNSQHFVYEYVSRRNNCCSVAWRALDAGGGAAFCSLSGQSVPKHYIYITPNDFHTYCERVANGLNLANNSIKSVIRSLDGNKKNITDEMRQRARIGFTNTHELYSARAFYDDSYIRWRIRGLILKRIDDALEEYHRKNWNNPEEYSDKLKYLLRVFKELEAHFRVESTVRDASLIALAHQAVNVANNLIKYAQQPWEMRSYYPQHKEVLVIQGRDNVDGKKVIKKQGMKTWFT